MWRALLDAVNHKNMRLWTSLSAAKPIGIVDGRLVLATTTRFIADLIEHKDHQLLLEQETEKLWGQRCRVQVQMEKPKTDEARPAAAPARMSRQDEVNRLKSEALNSPEIKRFIDTVDGEIV
jgi:chromosomal replication initiation ATPase DnaA